MFSLFVIDVLNGLQCYFYRKILMTVSLKLRKKDKKTKVWNRSEKEYIWLVVSSGNVIETFVVTVSELTVRIEKKGNLV